MVNSQVCRFCINNFVEIRNYFVHHGKINYEKDFNKNRNIFPTFMIIADKNYSNEM